MCINIRQGSGPYCLLDPSRENSLELVELSSINQFIQFTVECTELILTTQTRSNMENIFEL
jgi:hypothetical protein